MSGAEGVTTIALVGMGEMGSGIARRLVENGARVVTSLEGRGSGSAERAKAAGVDVVSEAEAIGQASIVLAIVPPAIARSVAEHIVPVIARSANKPTYIECNAVAPATSLAIAELFEVRGLPFGDASILGVAPKPGGASPRFYMSGAILAEAEVLRAFGIDTRVLSADIGDASALKMAYAGITKGFQALGTAMTLGAARNHVTDSFIAELKAGHPSLASWLSKQLRSMGAKAHRFDGEMREIAKFLEPERGSVEMLSGAAGVFAAVAVDRKDGPGGEIDVAIADFVERAAAS
jgi:3-hydroxyisobutyrate dehydrogenase-like beta-hydroxyacid dehydrogenase